MEEGRGRFTVLNGGGVREGLHEKGTIEQGLEVKEEPPVEICWKSI